MFVGSFNWHSFVLLTDPIGGGKKKNGPPEPVHLISRKYITGYSASAVNSGINTTSTMFGSW
jgi:hypothetical protein